MVDADRQSIQEYGILDHIERHLLFFRLTFNRSRSSRSSCSFAFKRANLLILSWSTRRTSASFSSSGWSMISCCVYGGLRGVLCLLSVFFCRCLLSFATDRGFGPHQHRHSLHHRSASTVCTTLRKMQAEIAFKKMVPCRAGHFFLFKTIQTRILMLNWETVRSEARDFRATRTRNQLWHRNYRAARSPACICADLKTTKVHLSSLSSHHGPVEGQVTQINRNETYLKAFRSL